jgi:hypothetical protein
MDIGWICNLTSSEAEVRTTQVSAVITTILAKQLGCEESEVHARIMQIRAEQTRIAREEEEKRTERIWAEVEKGWHTEKAWRRFLRVVVFRS